MSDLFPCMLLTGALTFMLSSCDSSENENSNESTTPSPYSGFTYPEGKFKAVVLSFDDGIAQDRGLVELFNRYGLRGTFNLNSGLFGSRATWLANQEYYIEAREVAELYAGHEISSHTRYHPYLTRLSGAQINDSVGGDQRALQALSNYPIKSLSYPFGSTDDAVISTLTELGISNARTVEETQNFALPVDRMRWGPTCHYRGANRFVDSYQMLNSRQLSVFYIWGHSWELDEGSNDWQQMEDFAEQITQDSNIWFTTAGELTDYLIALEAVQIDDSGIIHNPSGNSTIWIDRGAEAESLFAGESLILAQ